MATLATVLRVGFMARRRLADADAVVTAHL